MANHKSAKKRARQTEVRSERNKAKRSVGRSMIKSIRESISKKDKTAVMELLPKIQSILSKTAKVGVVKKNNASRRLGRLAKQAAQL